MRGVTKLFSINTDCCTYDVKRICDNGIIMIVVINTKKSPYGVVSVIRYPEECEIIKSPLLSIENLINCSNCYGVSPQTKYMNYAVQKGIKTSATAYLMSQEEYNTILKEMPNDCYCCAYGTNNDNSYPDMLYVCRHGKLNDYFNFDEIRSLYNKYYFGFKRIEWEYTKELFDLPLELFRDKNKCGFDLHNAPPVLGALLLGYPVETELAYLNHSERFCQNTYNGMFEKEAIKHFEQDNEPFIDFYKQKWIKHNGNIVCELCIEEKYF